MLRKIWKALLVIYLILLPWQTRWIYDPKYLNGSFWEYGSSSIYATEIVLWVIIVLYFFDRFTASELRHLFGRYHWGTHKNNFLVSLGFLFFLALCVLHSSNIAVSYEYFFHFIAFLCLFIILGNLENKKPYFTAVWAGGVGQATLAIFQFFAQQVDANKWLGLAFHAPAQLGDFVVESGTERWLRAYGSFGSPNMLGGYLAVMLTLGLILYLQSRPAEKIYLTLGQVLIFIGLVFSFSRGGYLAASSGVAMIGVSALRQSAGEGKWYSRFHPVGMYVKQCIFYTLVLAAMVPILSPVIPVRFDATQRLEVRSVSERAKQYGEAALLSKQAPWLGVGPGAYTFALQQIKPHLPAYSYQPVHNAFVLLFVEWGSVGAALWLAIVAFLASVIRNRHPEFLPLILVILVSAAFDHFWWSLPGGLAIWWTVFGLAL